MACTCLRVFLLGDSNAEKWGDHRKNFFIYNSVETLILLKEGHQGLFKLHVGLDEGVDIRGFQFGEKRDYLHKGNFV